MVWQPSTWGVNNITATTYLVPKPVESGPLHASHQNSSAAGTRRRLTLASRFRRGLLGGAFVGCGATASGFITLWAVARVLCARHAFRGKLCRVAC